MKRRFITAVVLVLMSGVILFGTIKIIDATQTDKPECNGQHPFNSIILEKQGTPCCPRSMVPPCPREVEEDKVRQSRRNGDEILEK